MGVLFVQTGPFAEAYTRLQKGGPETFRDQRASVSWVEKLSASCSVTTLALFGETHEDIQLTPQLRSVTCPYAAATGNWIEAFFDQVQPERLICRIPHHLVLRAAQRRNVPTLPMFADLFANTGPRALYRNLRLRKTLVGSHIPCVSNHNLNASSSVVSGLFYPEARVVPWDHYTIKPKYPVKQRLRAHSPLRIFYAGRLFEAKGLGDTLRALPLLKAYGVDATLTVAGAGDQPFWHAQVKSLNLEQSVTFLGLIPNTDVVTKMHAHDVVIVPSRHNYAEGLPNVIYEALASRTPLVISDHPAFAGRLVPEHECLVFRAGDPKAQADSLLRLTTDGTLYECLSRNSDSALTGLSFGLYWDKLWDLFLKDPTSSSGWVEEHSLTALAI